MLKTVSIVSRCGTRLGNLGVIAGLACSLFGSWSSQANEARVIEIAVAAPLSGELAHLGRDIVRGAELAVEEANRVRIRISGVPVNFRLRQFDDYADPRRAVFVATTVIDSSAVAVIGHLNSGVSIPASALYHRARLAQVTPASTNPALTQAGFDTVFRMQPSDAMSGRRLGRFAAGRGLARRVIAVIDDTEYGRVVGQSVASGAADGNGKLLGVLTFDSQGPDLTRIVEAIRGERPDAVIFGGMEDVGDLLLQHLKSAGLWPVILGGDGMCQEELQAATDLAVFCYVEGDSTPVAFASRFSTRFGSTPDVYAAASFDAANAVISAIRTADATGRAQIVEALKRLDVPGSTGRIRFDNDGERPDAKTSLFTYAKGKRVLEAVVP